MWHIPESWCAHKFLRAQKKTARAQICISARARFLRVRAKLRARDFFQKNAFGDKIVWKTLLSLVKKPYWPAFRHPEKKPSVTTRLLVHKTTFNNCSIKKNLARARKTARKKFSCARITTLQLIGKIKQNWLRKPKICWVKKSKNEAVISVLEDRIWSLFTARKPPHRLISRKAEYPVSAFEAKLLGGRELIWPYSLK